MAKRSKTISFYDAKEEHGIRYDWGLIKREFKKLKTPPEVYDPTSVPIESVNYVMELSTRSYGKTTQWLLMGLLMNQLYGTTPIVIRQTEEMTAPKHAASLLDVIRTYDNGRYIRQITEDRWNDVTIKARKVYYCLRDDRGDIVEKGTEPVIYLITLEENMALNSVFNAPRGDLIIFDEFISDLYRLNEFVTFCDELKTIIRSRLSPRVIMLSNTINTTSPYFRELEISKEVRKLSTNESTIVTTDLGTKIYVRISDSPSTRHKGILNSMFFGFKNPELAAIRGGETVWNFREVPRILYSPDDVYLDRRLKIDTVDDMISVDFVKTPDRGIVANVHPGEAHDDSIILTMGDIWDNRHRRGLGYGQREKALVTLLDRGKVYYSDCETAAVFRNYVIETKSYRFKTL